MAHDLTRQDLKRNELGEAVEAGFHFAEHHVKAILGAIGAVIALALLVWGILAWRGSRADAASERLGLALAVARAPIEPTGAKPDDPTQPSFASVEARDARAVELFTEVAGTYGATGAGQAAEVWLGQRALARGDQEEARRHWNKALERGTERPMAAAARLDLAQLDRATGRSEQLLAELLRERDAGKGPLPADALLSELARTYEALDRDAEARATWQQLVDEHGDSPYAAGARQQLTALPAG